MTALKACDGMLNNFYCLSRRLYKRRSEKSYRLFTEKGEEEKLEKSYRKKLKKKESEMNIQSSQPCQYPPTQPCQFTDAVAAKCNQLACVNGKILVREFVDRTSNDVGLRTVMDGCKGRSFYYHRLPIVINELLTPHNSPGLNGSFHDHVVNCRRGNCSNMAF